jgi:hypothetical protein
MPTPVSYSSMIRNQIAFDVLEVNTTFVISKEMEDDINTLTEYLGTLPDTPLDTYLKQNPNKEIVTINDDGEWMEVFLKDKK